MITTFFLSHIDTKYGRMFCASSQKKQNGCCRAYRQPLLLGLEWRNECLDVLFCAFVSLLSL